MRKLRWVLLTLIFIGVIASCEKDDICVEGNTPLLVLEFFDAANPTVTKNVTTLRIVGEGQNSTVNTFADRSNLSSVSLPLKTDNDQTTFYIIANSASNDAGQETGNVDTLTFSYDRIEDFVSRACGFIVNYENVSPELSAGSANWITDIEVIRASVTNSDSTHVKIFH